MASLGCPALRAALGLSQAPGLARSEHVGGLSDPEALRRLRRNPGAIVSLYDRHVARLVAALAAASGDRERAFDVAQEAFARAIERGHRVRVEEGGSAWPWLWTVARNILRDLQRRAVADRSARRRLGIASVAYDDQAIDDLIARVDAEELRSVLGHALEELPAEQRDAVVGRVILDRDYAALADDSVDETAIRARVSRGLRVLRIRLSGGRL
jgi:RNA polymerase sigma factor (sigma-70 family)